MPTRPRLRIRVGLATLAIASLATSASLAGAAAGAPAAASAGATAERGSQVQGGSSGATARKAAPQKVTTKKATKKKAAKKPVAPRTDPRPNILYVVTDDQTVQDLSARTMPQVTRHLVRQGTTFSGSMASLSYCCPSRASFQTGQLPQNHRVLSCLPPYSFSAFMRGRKGNDTLPEWLQRAGYTTGFTGKFINGNERSKAPIPPGWTSWRGFAEGTYNYTSQRVVTANNGRRAKVQTHRTYTSTTTGNVTVDLIKDLEARRKPWFIEAAFVAPHHGSDSDPDNPSPALVTPGVERRDRNSFRGVPMYRHPSYNEADVSDKNGFIRRLQPLSRRLQVAQQEAWEQRQEALRSVDRQVGRIVAELTRRRVLDKTVIVFTSDNGYELGDHRRVQGKITPYTGSTNVPLVIRGGGFPRNARRTMPVEVRDVTATVAQLAKARVPAGRLDGWSLLPARTDPAWGQRRAQLLRSLDGRTGMKYSGVRTARYTYVRFDDARGTVELYDHRRDPAEMTNLAADPAYRGIIAELRRLHTRLVDCRGASCNPTSDVDSLVPRVPPEEPPEKPAEKPTEEPAPPSDPAPPDEAAPQDDVVPTG